VLSTDSAISFFRPSYGIIVAFLVTFRGTCGNSGICRPYHIISVPLSIHNTAMTTKNKIAYL